jgi:3-hydroxyacyl-[acyl-carrier-protein] dehydratase
LSYRFLEVRVDIKSILKVIPHRFPILLVDRVKEIVPGERLVALKNVSINEPFFPGHFPHHPVMPGVLILEALAQASAILCLYSMEDKPDPDGIYYFVGIDGARFKKPVVPGDQLELVVKVIRSSRGIWKLDAKAFVDGQVVTEAELMLTHRPGESNSNTPPSA